MPLTQSFKTMLISSCALMLWLAACGGGGGPQAPSIGGGTPPDPQRPAPTQPPSLVNQSGVKKAATAIPKLGRRSVTQSSNTDRNNVTTDTVEAVFDHGQFSFSLSREDGTRVQLDSGADTVSTRLGREIRDNQLSHEWTLETQFAGQTVTVHGFGEIPDNDFPLRSIDAHGNYGTNEETVDIWEAVARERTAGTPRIISIG